LDAVARFERVARRARGRQRATAARAARVPTRGVRRDGRRALRRAATLPARFSSADTSRAARAARRTLSGPGREHAAFKALFAPPQRSTGSAPSRLRDAAA
jgi:hypothetical protein